VTTAKTKGQHHGKRRSPHAPIDHREHTRIYDPEALYSVHLQMRVDNASFLEWCHPCSARWMVQRLRTLADLLVEPFVRCLVVQVLVENRVGFGAIN